MLSGVVVTLETTGGVVSDATGGVSRNARGSPLNVPSPTIWPASLIALALSSTQPLAGGSRVLRSTIAAPASDRKARNAPEPSSA